MTAFVLDMLCLRMNKSCFIIGHYNNESMNRLNTISLILKIFSQIKTVNTVLP